MNCVCFMSPSRLGLHSRKLQTSQEIVVFDTDDVPLLQAMAADVPVPKMNGTCERMDMSEDGTGASSVSHSDSEKASIAQVLENILAPSCPSLLDGSQQFGRSIF